MAATGAAAAAVGDSAGAAGYCYWRNVAVSAVLRLLTVHRVRPNFGHRIATRRRTMLETIALTATVVYAQATGPAVVVHMGQAWTRHEKKKKNIQLKIILKCVLKH